jgi:lipid-binding SYLF domain-containing protein
VNERSGFLYDGSSSFGFQFGAQASEIVLLVMSPRGVESLLTSTFKLGGDVSVVVGPFRAGIESSTALNLSADLLSFARAKGLFGGISLEGPVIATRDEWNRNYYGLDIRPTDILVKRACDESSFSRLAGCIGWGRGWKALDRSARHACS